MHTSSALRWLALAALSACSSDTPATTSTIFFAPDPFAGLPVDDEGKRIVIDTESGGDRFRVRVDEALRDPLTAKGGCLHEVIACIERQPERGDAIIARCVSDAPTCASDRPWEEAERCCPAACQEAFAAAAPTDVAAAFRAHLADGRGCYPGLAAFLEGGEP